MIISRTRLGFFVFSVTILIQRALNDLVKSGEIIKIGGGRYTSYTWNREKD